MTRGTNLMQQLWFIIVNNSICFGHLYVHLQECRLCTAAYGVQHVKPYAAVHNLHSWRWTYRCPKHVELFTIINHNCCIKLVPLVIFIYDARSHIHQTPYICLSACPSVCLSVRLPVCPSVLRLDQLAFQWTVVMKFVSWELLENLSRKFKFY